MASPVIQNNFRARKSFAKIGKIIDIPNLIDIQKQSYEKFLQKDVPLDKREDVGLQGVFKSVFPIKDYSETSSIEFVSYALDKPKYDVDECRQRGMTFAAPIKVTVRLVVWDTNEETGSQSIRDVKEQEVFFGEIPLMTDNGTFIINGTERVVVSQLHRSPGVFFKRGQLFVAKIIPYRGSWVEFEYDQKNLLYVRVGKRKFLASIFLRALGVWLTSGFHSKSFESDGMLEDAVKNASYTDEDLLRAFYVVDEVRIEDGQLMVQVPETGRTNLVGMKVDFEIKGRGPDPIVRKGKEVTKTSLEGLRKANIGEVEIEASQFEAVYAAADVVNTETGEVIVEANNEITAARLQDITGSGVEGFSVF